MSKKNRPAILGLVEKAWGSVGQEAGVEDTIQAEGRSTQAGSRGSGSSDRGYSTKSPGRGYGGGRKGPRKPAAPSRPPRRP